MKKTINRESIAEAVKTEAYWLFLTTQLKKCPNDYHEFLSQIAMHLRAYYARRLINHSKDVEDLVQRTLVTVDRHSTSYDRSIPLTSWLLKLAQKILTDQDSASSQLDPKNGDASEDAFASAEYSQQFRHQITR